MATMRAEGGDAVRKGDAVLTITTTNSLDGYEVVEYLGIVTGEAVSGINMFRDIGAGLRNVFGGRSAGYEDEMAQAREEVLHEMSQRAENLGANAIIGANVGYETFAEMNDHGVWHGRSRAPQGVGPETWGLNRIKSSEPWFAGRNGRPKPDHGARRTRPKPDHAGRAASSRPSGGAIAKSRSLAHVRARDRLSQSSEKSVKPACPGSDRTCAG